MNKFFAFLIVPLLFACTSTKQLQKYTDTQSTYNYEMNLVNLKNDRIQVKLTLQGIQEQTLNFCFPKIVPGIYGAMDFGQYVSDLKAFDGSGNELPTDKSGINCWTIEDAQQIKTITYQVDDSWETFDLNLERGFYRSAASSFDDNSLVINNNCIFGYIRGHENKPFNIAILKPANYYGATSLEKKSEKPNIDIFRAADYHELVDNPILYSEPDVSHIKFEDIEVEVACYSSSGQKISKEITQYIRPLLENQRKYLGGKLPVSRYSFLIYHNLNPDPNSYMGDGLEHSHSTLILLYMPMDMGIIKENVYGIASHEFFHTIMPLGLHSQEVADYDFNDPRFSKHLWLYEGMTEYFTIHMPIKQNLQSLQEFFRVVQRKIKESKEFDASISLTELSRNPLEVQDQFYNVYLKGALLNMCMDIELRELSQGAYGVQDLVADMLEKYGPDRAFDDETFFEEIVKQCGYPQLSEFISNYIEGTKPLPIKDYLAKVGFDLNEGKAIISVNEAATEKQLQLRKFWIGQ